MSSNVPAVLSADPGIPLLGGAGAHKPRGVTKSPDEEDAPVIVHGNRLDIALWPPPKQQDYNKAQQRQAHERPIEGIITSVKPKQEYYCASWRSQCKSTEVWQQRWITRITSDRHERTVATRRHNDEF